MKNAATSRLGTLAPLGGTVSGVVTIPPQASSDPDWSMEGSVFRGGVITGVNQGFDAPTSPTSTPPAAPPPPSFSSIEDGFSQYGQLKITLTNDDNLIQQMNQAALEAHRKAAEADNNVAGANMVKQHDLESYQELLGDLIAALQGELARVTPPPTPTTATT